MFFLHVSKRRLSEAKSPRFGPKFEGGPRSYLETDSQVVRMTMEFLDFMNLNRMKLMQSSMNVNLLAREENLASAVLNLPVFLQKIEANQVVVSEPLRAAVNELLVLQNALIYEMFEFMKDAAQLFKLADALVMDEEEVLGLASSSSDSLSFKKLTNYVNMTVKWYLTLEESAHADNPSVKALNEYADLRSRILEDPEANQMIQNLWRDFQLGETAGAFNALCVPSGTGKTQLAFCMPDQCAVIYMNMSLSESVMSTEHQDIYCNFVSYMEWVIRKHKEDMSAGQKESFWVFGLVHAFMELLMKFPHLNLPLDLARIRITNQPSPDGNSFPLVSIAVGTAQKLLEKCQAQINKKIVFFIDEFTAHPKRFPEHDLAVFRRKIMDTGGIVVIASTDSGAANMLHAAAATDASHPGEKPWVYLFTRLPRYVPEKELMENVNSIQGHKGIKKLLSLCLTSRPRFAAGVVALIKEFMETRELWGIPETLIKFVEDLRSNIVHGMRMKAGALQETGCYGFVVAMLSAGCSFVGRSAEERQVLANLTTKNWAYLVNEESLGMAVPRVEFEEIQLDGTSVSEFGKNGDIDCHPTAQFEEFADNILLEKKERKSVFRVVPNISPVGEGPLFMRLFRGKISDQSTDHKLVFNIDTGRLFHCWSNFPGLYDDFLLYLGVGGSLVSPGLNINKNGARTRISTAKLIRSALETPRPVRAVSSNALSPDWEYDEMVVAAAFMMASNSASFAGSSLEEFLTRFVAELIDLPSLNENYIQLKTVAKINWMGAFRAQFMWPYNTRMAPEVNQLLGTINATRPSQSMMFDAGSYEPDEGSSQKQILKCLVEVKSSLTSEYVRDKVHDALHRQDSLAKVSFIVVDKSIEHWTKHFNLSKYQVLNRGAKGNNSFLKGSVLSNARLFKVGIEDRQVILKGLDGKRPSDTGNRLIFLISREDINTQAQRPVSI